jgi:hypothetical protein
MGLGPQVFDRWERIHADAANDAGAFEMGKWRESEASQQLRAGGGSVRAARELLTAEARAHLIKERPLDERGHADFFFSQLATRASEQPRRAGPAGNQPAADGALPKAQLIKEGLLDEQMYADVFVRQPVTVAGGQPRQAGPGAGQPAVDGAVAGLLERQNELLARQNRFLERLVHLAEEDVRERGSRPLTAVPPRWSGRMD